MSHDKSKGVQDVENLRNLYADKIKRDAETMLDEVTGGLVFDLPTIPVDVFNEVFRPYFEGGLDKVSAETTLNIWTMKIAGSLAVAVNIVDNADNVLVTVPPLMQLRSVDIQGANELSRDIELHELESANVPMIADNHFAKNMGKLRIQQDVTKAHSWEAFAAWLYTGKELPKTKKKDSEPKVVKDKSYLDDLF